MCQTWLKNRDGVQFTTKIEDVWHNDEEIEKKLNKGTGTTRMPDLAQIFNTTLTKDKVHRLPLTVSPTICLSLPVYLTARATH